MGLHKDVGETNMHEPKNMTTLTAGAADVGKVPISKGDGTTEARKLKHSELDTSTLHYGQLNVTNNTSTIALTAATDSTLATNSDYIQVTGITDALPHGLNNGITQQADTLTVQQDGDYELHIWVDASSSVASTVIAFKFAVNGVIVPGRRPKNFLRNSGEFHNMSAHEWASLSAGDVLSLWVASDKTINLTVEDAVTSVRMIRAT